MLYSKLNVSMATMFHSLSKLWNVLVFSHNFFTFLCSYFYTFMAWCKTDVIRQIYFVGHRSLFFIVLLAFIMHASMFRPLFKNKVQTSQKKYRECYTTQLKSTCKNSGTLEGKYFTQEGHLCQPCTKPFNLGVILSLLLITFGSFLMFLKKKSTDPRYQNPR